MPVAGNWLASASTPAEYAGALKWGTGINPVHAERDPIRKPTTTREPLLAPVDDAVIAENVLGASQWGYSTEEQDMYPGEDYRYLDTDHPNWGDSVAEMRPDRDGDIMEVGIEPQPEGFPSWGPHGAAVDADFPLADSPGGQQIRWYSDGLDAERRLAIARPGAGVSGGWVNKAHGKLYEAETSNPAQYEINTSMVQLHREMDNGRATARGTDDLRTAIQNRLTGTKAKVYGKSFGMGGGPATPDMRPVSQDTIPRRPWYFRGAAIPAEELHQYNEMTQFQPVQRTVPYDAGETVITSEATSPAGDYGYTTEDTGYGY